jgi:hypothetical protein
MLPSSIRKLISYTNHLMMYGEVMTVCCPNCEKTQNRDSGQNQIFKAWDIFLRL